MHPNQNDKSPRCRTEAFVKAYNMAEERLMNNRISQCSIMSRQNNQTILKNIEGFEHF